MSFGPWLDALFDRLPDWAPFPFWLCVIAIIAGTVGYFFGWRVGLSVLGVLVVVAALFALWLMYEINTSE